MQTETNNQHPYRHNNKTIREEYRIEFNWPISENPFFWSISMMCVVSASVLAFFDLISGSKDKAFDFSVLILLTVGLLSSIFRYIRFKKVQL